MAIDLDFQDTATVTWNVNRGVTPNVVTADAAGGGGGGTFNVTPDNHPAIPDVMDDEFESTVADPKWGWVNQGGASVILLGDGYQTISLPNAASTNFRGRTQAIAGAAWTIRTKLRSTRPAQNVYSVDMIGCRNSSSGKIVCFGVQKDGLGPNVDLFSYKLDNPTTVNGFTNILNLTANSVSNTLPWVYLQIELNSGNLLLSYSFDGSVFILAQTITLASFIISVDEVGLFCECEAGSLGDYVTYDWFRRIA